MQSRITWASGTSFVVLLLLAGCASASSKPSVIIVSPPSNSQFHEGADVAVQSNSTDSTGVVRVELIVDGNTVRVDPSPTAQGQPAFSLIQTWKATPGTHTLIVRAYNAAGAASDPVAISISVLQGVAVAPTNTPVAPPSPTVAPPASLTPTMAPPPTAGTTCIDNAAFVADVTIPDGTPLAAGQTFDKVWRISNTGACAWGAGYQFVFVSGEAMTGSTIVAAPNIAPGTTADIVVPMTAPPRAGAHVGVWRLRNAAGVFFGQTVTVKINVPGSPPPPTGCSGTPNIASFTASAPSVPAAASITVVAGTTVTLSWGAVTGAESAEVDQGIGGVETPGTRAVTPTTTTVYTLTARCGANTRTAQVIVNVTSPGPGAPVQASPADGWVWRVFPRTGTLTWNMVSFPGGVTYNVEIQIDKGAGWEAHTNVGGLAATSYSFSFVGDNPGRWRVWATSASAGAGAKSGWRSFSFNTGAAQYSGTWLNNDSGTSGITRIIITNAGQTLNVHPYGKCSPTDCDWGTRSGSFGGEPFVITFPGPPNHQLTITLNDAAGTSLKAIRFR